MKNKIYALWVCLVFVSFGVQAAGISRSAFTTEIVNKEPLTELNEISVDVTRVYFFTEIIGLNGHVITHRWEYNGQVMAEVNFQVNADRWRTWSSKNMLSSWTGKWQVSVLDEGGNVIDQGEFEYIVPEQELQPALNENIEDKKSENEKNIDDESVKTDLETEKTKAQ